MNRLLLLLSCFLLVWAVAGCGAGGAVSGPDSHTSAGLGTLIVSVQGQGEGRGVVYFQGEARLTSNGKAFFYNVPPGHYSIAASVEEHTVLLGRVDTEVDVFADKTVRLSLDPTVPYATGTPFPLKRAASPR